MIRMTIGGVLRRPALGLIALVLFAWFTPASARVVTFDERVDAQRLIEEIRWNHRIWPAHNPSPKPTLAEVMPESAVRAKVEDYLALSAALEEVWGRPITGEQLQSEVDRMARDTRNPRRLRELFSALNDDPELIAECLARPLLVERTVRYLYAFDSAIHGALQASALNSLETAPDARMLKSLGGDYGEVVLVPDSLELPGRQDGDFDQSRSAVGAEEWQRLSALSLMATGELVERAGYFQIESVLEKDGQSVRLARVRWHKPTFEAWWNANKPDRNVDELVIQGSTVGAFAYAVPATREDTCTDDTWLPTSTGTDVPDPREDHSAIWTGTEMIVWGGRDPSPLGSGGIYTPSTDSWRPTPTGGNAPTARFDHTAVWTGTEMVIWGGWSTDFENTGARLNPATGVWTPTLTGVNVPDARTRHKAVWTGIEMIVWGGSTAAGRENTGGLYDPNPATESWKPTSTAGDVPGPRNRHTAVWSGTEMIVWGGFEGVSDVNTGGRYDPVTDGWTATSTSGDVPFAREDHTAVWSGTEMIVWGGIGDFADQSGGRYDPTEDRWAATSTTVGDVPSARRWHTAVWADGEMIVWSGTGGGTTGGRYLPLLNSWSATSTGIDVPDARRDHTAVWIAPTNSQMIVWGGYTTGMSNTGGLYCAVCPGVSWYRDADVDDFGDPNVSQSSCNPVAGYVLDSSDCDDGNAAVFPGADQVCDGLNNDCDHPSWPGLAGTNEFDNDNDTFSTCGGDCDDADNTIWMIPGEVRQLTIAIDGQTLGWLPPTLPGGTAPVYDTIRADTPTTFDSPGFCVASDDPATGTVDADEPGTGAGLFYLIRAENGCGSGPVGNWSDGTPRTATTCP